MARRLVSSFVALVLFLSCFSGVLLDPGMVSAQLEPLTWLPVRTPSEEDFFVVSPSEVSSLVLGSSDRWYAADIPNEGLYRSDDGGITWQDDILDNLLDAEPSPPELPVWDLAVAPDDPDFVIAATDDRRELYLSIDGGEEWEHITASPNWSASVQIASVAVSLPDNDDQRFVAVGTRDPAGVGEGDVWLTALDGLVVSWYPQDLVRNGNSVDVSSVAFSPNFRADRAIVAIVSDADGTFLATGRNVDETETHWDIIEPDYFVELCFDVDDGTPTRSQLIYSDMVLPPTYDGDVAARRQVYVGYASTHDHDDVYRVDNNTVRRLGLPKRVGEDDVPVFSMALHGGRLMVGEVNADSADGRARIHITDDPTVMNPEWYEPEKRPSGGYGTGTGNAIVAFTPDGAWAVCGTSTNLVNTAAEWADMTGPWDGSAFDESAVSRAARADDYGIWNQISLIDTDIDELCDYSLWLSGGDNILYLASVGSGMDSIWRSFAEEEDELGERWERVEYLDSDTDDLILRRTPGTGITGTLFYAVRGTDQLHRSGNRGQTWERVRNCPDDLTDVAIVHDERIYVLSDELLAIGSVETVRQWEVWRWTYDIDTGLESGNTIRFFGESFIFIGDDGDGEIAVSKDGGETFELLPALPQPDTVHMALDDDFARNRILYAATESGMSAIYRWVIDGATSWTTLRPRDGGFSGLAHTRGVLYGAFGKGVNRTLVPRQPTVNVIDWDSLAVGLTAGTDFRPDTLRATTNDRVSLWAIDGRDYDYDAEEGRLWVYSDTFAIPTPWPVSPALNEVLACDICDCEAVPFCFEWKPLPKAELWDLWIAMDEDFRYVLHKEEDIHPVCCDSPGICDFELDFAFNCGTTYYWRVRATNTTEEERVRTRWSPSMHFLVAAGSTVDGMHVAPILRAPEPGARDVARNPEFSWTGFQSTTMYEFELAADEAFRTVLAREQPDGTAFIYPDTLEWGETYFWQVRALRPYPSEWSSASFTVMAQPEPPPEPYTPDLSELASAPAPATTPLWVWLVIGALGFLIASIILYVVIDRRR